MLTYLLKKTPGRPRCYRSIEGASAQVMADGNGTRRGGAGFAGKTDWGEAQPRATIRVVEAWPWASCVDLGWRGERMEQEDHGGRKGTVDSGWRTGVDEAALRRPGGREGGGGGGVKRRK